MKQPKANRMRTRLAGLLTVLLTFGLGMGAVVPANAVEHEYFTYSLGALNSDTGQALEEVEAGKQYFYTVSTNCVDPSGCGPATLKLTLPAESTFQAQAFSVPTGAIFNGHTGTVGGKGGVISVTWPNFTGQPVVYVPVKFDADLDTSRTGTTHDTKAEMTVGGIELEPRSNTVSLLVYAVPALDGQSMRWVNDQNQTINAVQEIQGKTARLELQGVANSNSKSEINLKFPGTGDVASPKLPVSEAFDLKSLDFGAHPSTIKVTYTLADGSTVTDMLDAATNTSPAPPNVVGYSVQVWDLPSKWSSTKAERTATVWANYELRKTQRSNPDQRIVSEGAQARIVENMVDVTAIVEEFEPGKDRSITRTTGALINVQAVQAAIEFVAELTTASGENSSLYGSGETNTATLHFANTGDQVLEDLKVTIPASASQKHFEYSDLTGLPKIKFPKGATEAIIQYKYGNEVGEVHSFTSSSAVPSPTLDVKLPSGNRTLGEVTGMIVVFTNPNGVIAGVCPDAKDTSCAGSIELPGKLRETLRSTGASIEPPAGAGDGATNVDFGGVIHAKSTTKIVTTHNTPAATLAIVKASFDAQVSKRFGNKDGTDQLIYPLTGKKSAGNIWDPNKGPGNQGFTPHQMRLTAGTQAGIGDTEFLGAEELIIHDPTTAPVMTTPAGGKPAEVKDLKKNPFNTMELAALDLSPAVCLTTDVPEGDPGVPVPSRTEFTVWLVDDADNIASITEKKVTANLTADELKRVVGLRVDIRPPEGDRRFSTVHLSCSLGEGTMIKFREYTLAKTEGATPERIAVTPAVLGDPATPGLFSPNNTAKVTTGSSGREAEDSAYLYLVDMDAAITFKKFASGAKQYGVQEQGTPSSFVLSAVPEGDDITKLTITDGSSAGNGFDVFDLTKLHKVHIGPDQKLIVKLSDATGAPLPVQGVIEPSIEVDGTDLTPDQIKDPQDPQFRKFWDVEREIEWTPEITDEDLAKVAKVEVEVVRSTPTDFVQQYSAASITVDVKLRDKFREAPNATVAGSIEGIIYTNTSVTQSISESEGALPTRESVAPFKVFAATDVYGHADTYWKDPDNGLLPLVAKSRTPSVITLDASNRTAVGVQAERPEDVWKTDGRIPVGVDKLTVGAGGTPADGQNPFAVVNFKGITQMWWPVRDGAKTELSKDPEDRVNGVITYTYQDGTTETKDAIYKENPSAADYSAMSPDPAKWPNVVGVSITWHEPGKYIGIERDHPTEKNRARLAFATGLRDQTRGVVDGLCVQPYTYHFVDTAGTGQTGTLQNCEAIEGLLSVCLSPSLLRSRGRGWKDGSHAGQVQRRVQA